MFRREEVKRAYEETNKILTELRNPKSLNLDEMTPSEIIRLIVDEEISALKEIYNVIDKIEICAQWFCETIMNNRRVFYMGAGTSGRIGIFDAAELVPTFGLNPNQVQGLIAGGKGSVFLSQEGAEDDTLSAIQELEEKKINERDMLIGLMASRRTPYVLEGLNFAKTKGAKTVLITTVPERVKQEDFIDLVIQIPCGPEVITGSTRMKSATVEKVVLNAISTTAMILMGKVYENLMVDLKPTSLKLTARAIRIISTLTGVDFDRAYDLLFEAKGNTKLAILMAFSSLPPKKLEETLENTHGNLRKAIELVKKYPKESY